MKSNYVLPRPADPPKIQITKNTRYPLVTLTVLKGFRVIMNILLNMKKMNFVDHDMWKYLELAMEKYIVYVCNIESGPLLLVPMEWERGLEKDGLMSLMHISHFGCTIEVNACVK